MRGAAYNIDARNIDRDSHGYEGVGGASEFFPSFFYTPKASRKEREAGLAEAGIEPMTRADVTGMAEGSAGLNSPRAGIRPMGEIRNTHPTVKPIAIMQWLVRLVSPPRSLSPVILDPFAGSGSTGVACVREGVRFVGVELDERHVAIARARIAHALETQPKSDDEPQGRLF
jgi:site-specific DNA-methyltransferase (adenine-specific)